MKITQVPSRLHDTNGSKGPTAATMSLVFHISHDAGPILGRFKLSLRFLFGQDGSFFGMVSLTALFFHQDDIFEFLPSPVRVVVDALLVCCQTSLKLGIVGFNLLKTGHENGFPFSLMSQASVPFAKLQFEVGPFLFRRATGKGQASKQKDHQFHCESEWCRTACEVNVMKFTTFICVAKERSKDKID